MTMYDQSRVWLDLLNHFQMTAFSLARVSQITRHSAMTVRVEKLSRQMQGDKIPFSDGKFIKISCNS